MGDVTGYSQIIAKGTRSWLQEPMAHQQQNRAWNENPPAWVSVSAILLSASGAMVPGYFPTPLLAGAMLLTA